MPEIIQTMVLQTVFQFQDRVAGIIQVHQEQISQQYLPNFHMQINSVVNLLQLINKLIKQDVT